MSLPDRTTILIVGAGPSGLACALSLVNQGFRDFVIVDAVLEGENTSRALIIHAATLEVRHCVHFNYGCSRFKWRVGSRNCPMCGNPC
jgi:2-polyprenyl-6-methoxyphenol hydroxylase-like FAD-dependent oxidoreductase